MFKVPPKEDDGAPLKHWRVALQTSYAPGPFVVSKCSYSNDEVVLQYLVVSVDFRVVSVLFVDGGTKGIAPPNIVRLTYRSPIAAPGVRNHDILPANYAQPPA